MAGHNKWTQIKRRKVAEDIRRSRRFSLLAKTITMEIKKANGDHNLPTVRQAIERARAENIPNDTIERAIRNASSDNKNNLEEVIYEAYGPSGVALIIEGITNNRNRTGQEIKHLLAINNASLATPGAAIWFFKKTEDGWQSITTIEVTNDDINKLSSLIENLTKHEDVKNVWTNASNLEVENKDE